MIPPIAYGSSIHAHGGGTSFCRGADLPWNGLPDAINSYDTVLNTAVHLVMTPLLPKKILNL